MGGIFVWFCTGKSTCSIPPGRERVTEWFSKTECDELVSHQKWWKVTLLPGLSHATALGQGLGGRGSWFEISQHFEPRFCPPHAPPPRPPLAGTRCGSRTGTGSRLWRGGCPPGPPSTSASRSSSVPLGGAVCVGGSGWVGGEVDGYIFSGILILL